MELLQIYNYFIYIVKGFLEFNMNYKVKINLKEQFQDMLLEINFNDKFGGF